MAASRMGTGSHTQARGDGHPGVLPVARGCAAGTRPAPRRRLGAQGSGMAARRSRPLPMPRARQDFLARRGPRGAGAARAGPARPTCEEGVVRAPRSGGGRDADLAHPSGRYRGPADRRRHAASSLTRRPGRLQPRAYLRGRAGTPWRRPPRAARRRPSIASSSDIGSGTIPASASMPRVSTSSAPLPRPPERQITGTPWRRATAATPTGALPMAVWKSVRPSPVRTSVAPSTSSSNPVASSTISTPGRSRAGVKSRRPAPRPPAAPAPGMVATSRPVATAADAREARQGQVERGHHLGRGALLRAVDGRRAARAGERVVHVAGDQDLRPGQPRVGAAQVDALEARQRGAALGQLAAGRVEEADPERPGHARPAVVGGAAPDADDQPAEPRVQGGADQLAGPAGAGERGDRAGRRARATGPEAAAISMTAVAPSPSTPQRASTGSPSGPRHPGLERASRRSRTPGRRRCPRRRRRWGRGEARRRGRRRGRRGPSPPRLPGRIGSP